MSNREHRVRRVWLRIEGWLRTHAPEVLESLGEGASNEQIRSAEEALELELPDDFRLSLQFVDGSGVGSGGLVDEWKLLSIDEVVEQYRGLMDLYERGLIPVKVSTEGPARANAWTPRRIPFSRKADGDFRFLDLDPGDGGHPGQVVRAWRQMMAQSVEAPTFIDFLETVADDLERGRWRVGSDGTLEKVSTEPTG